MGYKPENGEVYQGKQVIIDSDRLLFNAKGDSILLFAKKAIGFSAQDSIHFDTSDEKEGDKASKLVINSPNIYIGLKYDKNLPTEPALLGDEFDEWANELLDCIDGLMDDIVGKISYMAPTGPTGPGPTNEMMLSLRRKQVKTLRSNIQYIKSKITKLG
tara:strand:+ start:1789 stop:2265 length:477 start_codon:yes stop_codon:yes gene_type:complete